MRRIRKLSLTVSGWIDTSLKQVQAWWTLTRVKTPEFPSIGIQGCGGESGVHVPAFLDCCPPLLWILGLSAYPCGYSPELWRILSVFFLSNSFPSLQILFLLFCIPFSVPLHPSPWNVPPLTTGIPRVNKLPSLSRSTEWQVILSYICFWCLVGSGDSTFSACWFCAVEYGGLEEKREKSIFWEWIRGKWLQSSILAWAYSQLACLKSSIWTTRLIFLWKPPKFYMKESSLIACGPLVPTLLC